DPALARVGGRAGVCVVAGRAVGDGSVLAARGRIAGVGGANVPIVAVRRSDAHGDASRTRVGGRAGVCVVAGRAVGDGSVLAAGGRIAGGGGASIAVVALRSGAARADSALARVGGRAGVCVVAGRAVGDGSMLAAGGRITRVGGANVPIVAVRR